MNKEEIVLYLIKEKEFWSNNLFERGYANGCRNFIYDLLEKIEGNRDGL
jgi:hypothetical protein